MALEDAKRYARRVEFWIEAAQMAIVAVMIVVFGWWVVPFLAALWVVEVLTAPMRVALREAPRSEPHRAANETVTRALLQDDPVLRARVREVADRLVGEAR